MIIDYHSPACKRRLSLALGLLLSVFLFVQNAAGQCTYLQNTDFENTQITLQQQTIAQSTGIIAPWKTTARDGAQEVWRNGFNGVPSYSGNQFIELNANIAATTYQDFVAPGGTMFTLNFAHRGRSGIDVMNVSIGSPSPTSMASGTAVSGTTYLNLGNFSDGNTAWGYYTVSFTLPTGVANNAFSIRFATVSSTGGDASFGNFLDAISISDVAPAINGTRSVTLTCPTTTTDLSGFTATNQPSGTTQTWHTGATATDANRLASVTAVGPGTYYTAFYNGSKTCYGGTTTVVVNGPTGVPAAPTVTLVQPVCALPTGTITITAPLGAGLTYSIDGTNYSSALVYAGVASGTYAVRARNGTSSLCTSAATSVTINAALLSPAAPTATVTTQTNCTLATGTITVTAPTGTGISYSINGSTYTNTNGIFTGVSSGTYAVTARNTAGCVSPATSVTVNAQPATPVAPTATVTAQPNCTLTTGTITVSAPIGASLTYSIDGTNYTNTSGIFTGVASGTYAVTVRNASGCTSPATSVTVSAQPATPVAPTATVTAQPNCTLATGTITITAPTGASLTYSIDGTTYTNTSGIFTGVDPGTYPVTVRNAAGCVSSATSVTVNAQPPIPVAPSATVTIQPNCTLANGTITVTAPTGASLTYSINGTTYTNTTGVFTGVAPGTYAVTVRNANGCTSTATSVTVNAQPATPVAPTATVTAQPNCTLATGTITVSAPTGASLTYSIDGTNYSNTTGVFTGVASGTYAVTVRNASGCTSAATSVTVNAQPPSPVAPTATVTVQPNCTLATGTITVSAPTGASLTYSTNGTSYTNTSGVFNALAPGSYSVTVRNSSGCTSPVTSVTVNAQPTTPVAPTATVTAQPNCTLTTGTITVSAPTGASLTYSIDGTNYTNTSGIFTGVASGTYAVTVRNASGCTSAATSVTVNAQPATPVLAINSATTCAGVTTTLTVSGCTGGTLIWNTRDNTTSITVTPLVTTSYSVTCTGSNGCSAVGSTTVTVRPTPIYGQQPTVTLATCTGTVANSDAQITLAALQNTERADIVANGTYTGGPAYGAASNRLVSGNTVSFTNLPNPASNQLYTVRLFSAAGICVVDVVVTLSPTDCRCTGCPKVLLTPKR